MISSALVRGMKSATGDFSSTIAVLKPAHNAHKDADYMDGGRQGTAGCQPGVNIGVWVAREQILQHSARHLTFLNPTIQNAIFPCRSKGFSNGFSNSHAFTSLI